MRERKPYPNISDEELDRRAEEALKRMIANQDKHPGQPHRQHQQHQQHQQHNSGGGGRRRYRRRPK